MWKNYQITPEEWKKLSKELKRYEKFKSNNFCTELYILTSINQMNIHVPCSIAFKWGFLEPLNPVAIPIEITPGVDDSKIDFFNARYIIERWSCNHIDLLETDGLHIPVYQEKVPVGTRGKFWTPWKSPVITGSDSDDDLYD